ncbi:MAG: Hydroxymethylglutaryl-CoA synthase [Candidatus Thermoplasmatota archaeon]|nr:Hydroxymethylglutaryl-CoA synthase [Candidatus Thermoplasmatota archaeon]
MMMSVGISGYSAYVPRLRIKKEDYAKAWGSFQAAGVAEKSVMGFDEDVLTAAAKVSRKALESVPLPPGNVTRFAFASTTAPYLEKLLSGTVLVNVGMPNGAFASDHTTSTRAGTEAFISAFEHVKATQGGVAVVAAADAPRASMWDPLEHPMGAGAAGFVLSSDNLIAEVEGYSSYVMEHFGERFRPTGGDLLQDLSVKKFFATAFMTCTTKACGALVKKLGAKPEEYAHVVIQQPDAKTPGSVAGKMLFNDAQMASGLVSTNLGDLGAASTPVGLAAALDSAKVGDRIMVVSYGSGAGSDAISLKVVSDRKPVPGFKEQLEKKEYIDYIQYVKLKGALK